jgi:FdrA protein
MLGGVGLGFANVVRHGSVGIVAAAGTGAQETACLLDAAGVGVSHIVGVGGRDLSQEVGGIMFCEGMRLLAADDPTDTLLLVSKPPAADAVRALGEAVPADVRVVAAFVGCDGIQAPFVVHSTLEAAAAAAANVPPTEVPALEQLVSDRKPEVARRPLLGLYSGGSLAHEAATILEPTLGPIAGNVGHGPDDPDGGHALVDLGEGEYTRGRPHPMVDLDTRIGMLQDAMVAQQPGCVLLDVVLGYGAHPDPATGLAETVSRAAKNALVIAHVCGTPDDPQDARRQEDILSAAGAVVAPTNAAAARLALRALT